nr:putative ribonuclease H-like domain-containing protein [Tanacetum cinerariifolium]
MKGIKREFSVAKTPQQNEVAERKNMTLIKAARTMLADLLLPILFWVEAVNTACYVQNRVLVTKPHNKTAYELLLGRTPSIGFMRPFGYPVTIFNTLDPLGKFDGKANEGFLNTYADVAFDDKENESEVYVSPSSSDKPNKHDEKAKREAKGKSLVDLSTRVRYLSDEFEEFSVNSSNKVNAASALVIAVGPNSTNSTNSFNDAGTFDNVVSPNFEIDGKYSFMDPSQYPDDPDMPALEYIIYLDDEEDVGAEADFSNLETSITDSPISTTRVHKDHLVTQIIGDLSSAPQTRSMARMVKEQGGLNQINDVDFHTCMFTCFLSQEEPKRVHQALKDPSWIEVMQEELLQFKMQKDSSNSVVFSLCFLYGIYGIKEEVYVCQPPGFKDPDYPDKVYKVVKALYGLHQAPRAWYETLANYLLENSFQRGNIDQNLFIKKQKGDILLVQAHALTANITSDLDE